MDLYMGWSFAPFGVSAGGGEALRDLDGVEGGALAEVVVADEERDAAVAVLADPADVARVAAGGEQRRRDVDDLDLGPGGVEELDRPRRGDRTFERGVDRQGVAGEDG